MHEIVIARGQLFQAVDSHNQLRLGQLHFCFVARSKLWPKVFIGFLEILLIYVCIVCKAAIQYEILSQNDFRWNLVEELLDFADNLEDSNAPAAASTQMENVGRHDAGASEAHHHDTIPEYFTPEKLDYYTLQMEKNRPVRL